MDTIYIFFILLGIIFIFVGIRCLFFIKNTHKYVQIV
jgi:hypothetical protein